MREIHKFLLKLLKEIDELCVNNDIEYYIFAGSILGIERNEGFLPWDDDIDIVMTKKNYEKFAALMEAKNIPDRTFESIENNPEYPLHFGKYMATNTSHITRSLSFGNSSAGIWIDVMYVVPLPREKHKVDRIKRWFCVYCELENELYMEHTNRYKGFYWRYKLGLFLISIFGKKRVIQRMRKMFDNYPEEECDSYFLHHSLDADFRQYDKKFFGKPVRRLYNGIEVNVSPYNREFCRAAYGDAWMIVPEEQHQDTHTVIQDFEYSYTKYADDYMVLLDKDEVAQTVKKAKVIQTKVMYMRRKIIKKYHHLKGLLLAEHLKDDIVRSNVVIDELIANEDYPSINDLYKDYEDYQLSRTLLYWQIFVPVDDDILYPFLVKLVCYDGRYYLARKILALREASGKNKLFAKFNWLLDLIEICKQVSVALWDKEDYEEVDSILKSYQCTLEVPCIDLQLAQLHVAMHNATEQNDYYPIREKANAILSQNPQQGECMKILGDIETIIGNSVAASTYYHDAYENTDNGLTLLEIHQKGIS